MILYNVFYVEDDNLILKYNTANKNYWIDFLITYL